jgi:RNA methyltransferase, TrmH family
VDQAGFHHPIARAARALHIKKHRVEQRCFLIEGPTPVQAALDALDVTIERIFVPQDASSGDAIAQKAAARNIPLIAVDERTMRSLAQTRQPQGIVAVARFFHRDVTELPQSLPAASACLVLVLDEISDPGNAGTLLRSAEAFGAAAVCLGSSGVDPYNDKVVRSSMGSMFHVPLFSYGTWAQLADAAGRAALQIVGSEAGAQDVRAVTPPSRIALVIGHERRGLAALGDGTPVTRVGIPQSARAESLNAAVAGSIVMYELARAIGVLGAAAQRTKAP